MGVSTRLRSLRPRGAKFAAALVCATLIGGAAQAQVTLGGLELRSDRHAPMARTARPDKAPTHGPADTTSRVGGRPISKPPSTPESADVPTGLRSKSPIDAGAPKTTDTATTDRGEHRFDRTGHRDRWEAPGGNGDMGVGLTTGAVEEDRLVPTPREEPAASDDLAAVASPLDAPAMPFLPDAQSAPSAERGFGPAIPPAGERRLFSGEAVVEVPSALPPGEVAALERRHALRPLDRFASQLTGTTIMLEATPDSRDLPTEIGELGADPAVLSAQPNYLFETQASAGSRPDGESLQYAADKLNLPRAHRLARGGHILVAVIDSGVETANPELTGAIAGTFDATGKPLISLSHGTAIAGLIAAHARLIGSAPAARILAVRAFVADGSADRGSTFTILKGLDWAVAQGARVINMSFAGPPDPAVHRALAAAYRLRVVLVAAAGNAGPYSPPLYPAADPSVMAVSATDAADGVYAGSNRGRYIQMAAPGVDVLVAAPDGGYQISSGTSLSAAEVSGVVALLVERRPDLGPDAVRAILLTTARPLTPQGAHGQFEPKLVDAYRAVLAVEPAAPARSVARAR